MVGVNLHLMKVDLSPIWYQEVNLIGSMAHGTEQWPVGTERERSTFALTSDLITNRLLHPEKLITHRFALSNFREALQTASSKKSSRAIKVVFDAALLPASSVPTTPTSVYARLPQFIASLGQQKQIASEEEEDMEDVDTQTIPTHTPADQPAPATGPSHFTQAQSEDLTADFDADFDSAPFISPKPHRSPTPLLFHATDDLPQTSQPISPGDATNAPSQTLQKAGKPDDASSPAHSSDE